MFGVLACVRREKKARYDKKKKKTLVVIYAIGAIGRFPSAINFYDFSERCGSGSGGYWYRNKNIGNILIICSPDQTLLSGGK